MTRGSYEGAILWDLDGTLLTTAKAGRIALRQAVAEVTGRRLDLTGLHTSGLTDAEVAAEALRAVGVEPDDDLVRRVLAEYEQRLPDALPLREGAVLPGVQEALEGLAAGGRVVSLLLTGNTCAGAKAKLERYRLDAYFPHGGAFCEGPGGRVPIAKRALETARDLLVDFDEARLLLVGDTPLDVKCAHELGVRSVAIATGTHSAQELEAAGAWRVLECVPDARVLETLVLDGGGERP